MGLGAGAGGAKGEELRLTRSWENKKEAQGPKHGKAPDGWPARARTPPLLRTNRTRRVLHPVLIGHAASLTPY
jgi:hypothetical protein